MLSASLRVCAGRAAARIAPRIPLGEAPAGARIARVGPIGPHNGAVPAWRVAAQMPGALTRRTLSSRPMPKVCAVLGAQWGDEGKGKLVDVLARRYNVVARFNGGANAGHTIVVDGRKFAFHLLPCGLLHEKKINIIGNGVVVHIPSLLKELKMLDEAGVPYNEQLKISDRAHVLFDFHQTVDGLQESARRAGEALGTTRRGIGPCYATKATRNGVRMGALKDWPKFEEQTRLLCSALQQQYGFQHDVGAELQQLRLAREKILHMITDTAFAVNRAYDQGQYILAEGANAAMLDIDAGTYPFVTSSSTAAGGVCTGLGLPPARVHCTIGVVKAYTTRVGAGPFPTELKDSVGDMLVNVGKEFGTTTGRRRRTGWLDLAVVRYSHMLNAYDSINITKLDVLSQLPELQVCVAYKIGGRELAAGLMPASLEDLAQVEPVYETLPGWQSDISTCRSFGALPRNAQRYVQRIEELTGVPVSWIGVGAGRDDMALHRNHF